MKNLMRALAILLLFALSAWAANPTAQVHGDLRGIVSGAKGSHLISVKLPGGIYQFQLWEVSYAHAEPRLFQGLQTRRNDLKGALGLGADLSNDALSIITPSRRNGRMFKIVIDLHSGLATFSYVPLYRRCALESGTAPILIPSETPLSPYTPTRYIQISTDTDLAFAKKYGSRTNAYIRTILNAVEGIYLGQLGIRFEIVKQHATSSGTDIFESSDSEVLLSEFQAYTVQRRSLGTSDTYHLFTGKPLDSGVIGLSYVGAICQLGGDYSFGLSSRVNEALQPLVTAHELGHVLGASHDPSEESSLMSPYLSTVNNTFSAFSLNEIHGYIDENGQCLDPISHLRMMLELQAQSSIRSLSLRGEVYFSLVPADSCSVKIYAASSKNNLTKTAIDSGRATLVFAAPEGTLTFQRAISVRRQKRSKVVYFRALAQCGVDPNVYSPIQPLKTKNYGVSPKSLITALGKLR